MTDRTDTADTADRIPAHARLGDFTAQASAYAASRPSYPEPLLDQLIAHVGVAPGDPVVDLGAGTGILTGQLAARGFAITAVEPNSAMRDLAPDLSDVAWVDGTFEHTGLPDASQHWAVAAQSFHWAEPEQALPEVRRVLRPGGHFTVLWNDRDTERSEVLRETRRIIGEHAPGFDELYRNRDWAAALAAGGHFTDVTAHDLSHDVSMSPDRYLGLWRSHNRLTTYAGPVALERILHELAVILDDRDMIIPYRCRAWTARRR